MAFLKAQLVHPLESMYISTSLKIDEIRHLVKISRSFFSNSAAFCILITWIRCIPLQVNLFVCLGATQVPLSTGHST